MRLLLVLAFLFLTITGLLNAQGTGVLAVQSSYARAYAIVPLVGRGTFDDPVRPMFAPTAATAQSAANREISVPGKLPERTGIIGYASVTTDDGKAAIVELVAVNRQGLRDILESKVPGIQVFELGRASTTEIEAAFRRVKRDFDLTAFQSKVR